jgi:hypothetical protein
LSVYINVTPFRSRSYNQRMAVRHRRNEKRLLKRTIAALEKQILAQGLEADSSNTILLQQAGDITLGQLLPGDERRYGMKQNHNSKIGWKNWVYQSI